MMGELLFEIPVYRVSPDSWLAEVEEYEALCRGAYLRQIPEGARPNPRSIEHYLALCRHSAGYDVGYDYNQVVGWIRVERDGTGVMKAYAHKVMQKRFTKRFKAAGAKYRWEGKVLELWFDDETSEQIAAKLRQELVKLTRSGETFPRRHLALEAFDALAPCLKWRRLLGLTQPGE